MIPGGTIMLSREDIASLLTIDECIDAVEKVFRLAGEGRTTPPGILGIRSGKGGFHIKAGFLDDDRSYFAAKINANFPENPRRFGLPTIQGVILLSDAGSGYPLAVMDSIEITILRTGAATAVAAKHLSRTDSNVVTICGCGTQGRIQLRSLLSVLPLKQAYLYDIDVRNAIRLAGEFSDKLQTQAITQQQLPASLGKSDICVTCTTSEQFFVRREDISPGTFIAAVGADSEHKQEIDPLLFSAAGIVVDSLDQCAAIGDLHHALTAGIVQKADVRAELGKVVAGKVKGRTSAGEITIFDSTGIALEDCAAAIRVYRSAIAQGAGRVFHFNQTYDRQPAV